MAALAHLKGVLEHLLVTHLVDVARKTEEFARHLRPGDDRFAALALWAGLLHDLGKYRREFQEYLKGELKKGIDTQHAVFGAAWAWERLAKSIGLVINGHHAGLHDFGWCENRVCSPELQPLPVAELLFDQLKADLAARGASLPPQATEVFERRRGNKLIPVPHSHELMTRMLFSCLVDADYLDTEQAMQGSARVPRPLDAAALYAGVERHVSALGGGSVTPSRIQELRREIYAACVAKAEHGPGLYCLTAPTGGGKTLAGLAFALKHAERNRLDRVIVVLPFLTIIEQNAAEYRKVLGDEVVVEHHSGATPGMTDDGDSETADQIAAKQATENWDAPIIVTTAVQFLESLFDRKPSRCRKLHNIARAVVVFDEVQTLPHHLLEPILNVIRDLKVRYGTSFLFCSATQPRFAPSHHLPSGFNDRECVELAPDPQRVFGTLQRARYDLAFLTEGQWDWDALVDRIEKEPRVLVIVNLRRIAAKLFGLLHARKVEGLFHLSSTMCPAHRSQKLGKKDTLGEGSIHLALKEQRPCRVISTQVVEAGVDIDFPVVFRALGPLDSIIQAAGRCNREGKIPPDSAGRPGGRVVVFELKGEKNTPPRFYAFATRRAREVLTGLAADPDRLATDPDVFARYHDSLVAWEDPDAKNIQDDRAQLRFEEVARKFRMIDQAGETVVVPYNDEANALLKEVAVKKFATIEERRRLQKYAVSLYPHEVRALGADVRPLVDGVEGVWRLDKNRYGPDLGVSIGESPVDAFIF